MFFLDEVYATKCIQKPVDLQSDRRRSRSSSLGIPDAPRARSRGVSVSSLEQRAGDQPSGSKRNSIFSLRPKSALTTYSSDGSTRSGSPAPANSGNRLRSSSMGVERSMSPTPGDESQARLVFTRNGKNSLVTVRSPSPMDADDEGEAKRRNRTLQKRSTSAEPKRSLIRISAPFGFRHISGIGKEIAPTMLKATRPHLREVKSGMAVRVNESAKPPAPLRPQRPDELLTLAAMSPPPPLDEPRRSRSAELVDQTDGILGSQPITAIPPLPMPRKRSSHRSTKSGRVLIETKADGSHVRLHTAKEPKSSGNSDRLVPTQETKPSLETNDTAYPAQVHTGPMPEGKSTTSTFAPLELVPEEPEGTVSSRQSTEAKAETFNRQVKSSSTFHKQDSPKEEEEEEEEEGEENVERLVTSQEELLPQTQSSHGSNAFGDSTSPDCCESPLEAPVLPRRNPSRQYRKKEAPKPLMDIDSNWEDDVDYCYEHRAESNCNFDWNNMSILKDATSDDEPETQEQLPWQRKKKLAKQDEKESTDKISCGNTKRFRQIPFALSEDSVPELDGQSAHTCSTNSFSALTFTDRHESIPEILAALTLDSGLSTYMTSDMSPIDIESPMTTEQMYHELLSGHDLPDESRPSRLETLAKSNDTQSSSDQEDRPLLSNSPVLQPTQEKGLPSLELTATNASDQPPKSNNKLSLGSMVAMIRRTSESGASTVAEERDSRTLSRSSVNSGPGLRSRSRSLSRHRAPSISTPEPASSTPTLPKADTGNSLVSTFTSDEISNMLNLPEIPVGASNWTSEFEFETSGLGLLGMNYKGWHSTPALVLLDPPFADTTKADSPPASPSIPKAVDITADPPPIRHSLFVREPKTPLPPPSPPAPPPKDLPRKKVGSAPKNSVILKPSVPSGHAALKMGSQSYCLVPQSSSLPGSPRIVERTAAS